MRISDWSSDVCSSDLRIDADIRDIEDIDAVAQPGKGGLAAERRMRRRRGIDERAGDAVGPRQADQRRIAVERPADVMARIALVARCGVDGVRGPRKFTPHDLRGTVARPAEPHSDL